MLCQLGIHRLLEKLSNDSPEVVKVSVALRLPLLDAHIRQYRLAEARRCLSIITLHIKSDSVADLRCFIAKAKMAQLCGDWQLAQEHWRRPLELVNVRFRLGRTNNPFTAEAILRNILRLTVLERIPQQGYQHYFPVRVFMSVEYSCMYGPIITLFNMHILALEAPSQP